MHIKYLTTEYRVSGEKYTPQGQLTNHITTFPRPLLGTIKNALEKHLFSLSISQLESIIGLSLHFLHQRFALTTYWKLDLILTEIALLLYQTYLW